jgi:hypothetical protein
MAISGTTESAILALTFNATLWANYGINATTTPETNISFALHTADPGTAGTQDTSAIAYTSYARVNVARTTGGFTVTGTGPASCSPVAAVNFPAGTGGSGTAAYFSTGKASVASGSGPAILWSGTVTPNIVTGSGVTPSLSTATTMTLS